MSTFQVHFSANASVCSRKQTYNRPILALHLTSIIFNLHTQHPSLSNDLNRHVYIFPEAGACCILPQYRTDHLQVLSRAVSLVMAPWRQHDMIKVRYFLVRHCLLRHSTQNSDHYFGRQEASQDFGRIHSDTRIYRGWPFKLASSVPLSTIHELPIISR